MEAGSPLGSVSVPVADDDESVDVTATSEALAPDCYDAVRAEHQRRRGPQPPPDARDELWNVLDAPVPDTPVAAV